MKIKLFHIYLFMLVFCLSSQAWSEQSSSGTPTVQELKQSWNEVKLFVDPLTKLLLAQSDRIKKLEQRAITLESESENLSKASQEWQLKYEQSEKDKTTLTLRINDLSKDSKDTDKLLNDSLNEITVDRTIIAIETVVIVVYVLGRVFKLF